MKVFSLYIYEGIDEKKQLSVAQRGTFVHYHKFGLPCVRKCFVHPGTEDEQAADQE